MVSLKLPNPRLSFAEMGVAMQDWSTEQIRNKTFGKELTAFPSHCGKILSSQLLNSTSIASCSPDP